MTIYGFVGRLCLCAVIGVAAAGMLELLGAPYRLRHALTYVSALYTTLAVYTSLIYLMSIVLMAILIWMLTRR
jgi:hypothetical protein